MSPKMPHHQFVGIDWGTSSFRAWHFHHKDAPRLIAKSDQGMAKLQQNDFAPYLENVLREGGIDESAPIRICGMAGARDGWHEVAYAKAPATREAIAKGAVSMRAGGYHCKILPGVSLATAGRFDVMRGEETLLFGALNQGTGDGLYCLPGTHSKWCQMQGGQLQNWQTAMTGEMFALLATQSTLSPFCDSHAPPFHEKSEFCQSVRTMIEGKTSLMHALFSIRAQALLDAEAESIDFTACLSGLLIGQEIAGAAVDAPQVILIASGQIGDAYSKALTIAGIKFTRLDAEKAVQAGLALFHEALRETPA